MHRVTLSGITFGAATVGSATGITVSTSKDLTSVGVDSGSLGGGQVTGLSFTIAAADCVSASTDKQVTISFFIETGLVSNQFIFITWPFKYLSFSPLNFFPGTVSTFSDQISSDDSGLSIRVGQDKVAANGSYTITLGGATIGPPVASDPTGISVSTSVDKAARTASPAIGGQVSILTSLSLVTGDRVGGLPTFGVVSIVFRPASAIPAGGTITINTPYNYFATRAAIASVGSSSTIACASSACLDVVVGDIAVSNTAAAGSRSSYGSITVVIGGSSTAALVPITLVIGAGMLTTGMPQAATTNGITVATSQDYASAGAESLALLSEEIANLLPTTSSPSQACTSSHDESGPNIVGLSYSTRCASKDGTRSCFIQSTSLITGNPIVIVAL
jgi:hypothetical protein